MYLWLHMPVKFTERIIKSSQGTWRHVYWCCYGVISILVLLERESKETSQPATQRPRCEEQAAMSQFSWPAAHWLIAPKASYYYYHHNYCIISKENIISRHCLMYHVPLNCTSPIYICYGLNVSVPTIPMLDLIL